MTLPGVEMIAHDPGMDIWEQIIRKVETDVDSRGWDQPTEIYNLYTTTLGIGLARTHLPVRLGKLYPPALLDTLTARLVHRPPDRLQRDQSLVGVVLVIEGWCLRIDRRDTAAFDAGQADAAAHRIRHRPDRIEYRQADLVTLTGIHLTLARPRGEAPQIAPGATGLVPEALHRFVAALAAS